ncbi:aldo/keto reductase [Streptomyces sp. NPDC051665]|uniref:aldo/keto reductase n=1 Tax=Streptomyces sp. NPDC051665 TaxID=3154647 RepID=UPI00342A3724
MFPDSDRAIVETVQRIASARGVLMAQIAMAWVLKNPVVSAPIVGVTKPHHLTDATAALDIDLTAEEIDSLEAPYVTRRPTFFRPKVRCRQAPSARPSAVQGPDG